MTLAEILVASAITTSLGAGIVLVVHPIQTAVRVEDDAMDMEGRLRFAVDTLTRDLLAAHDVLPYRVGAVAPDPPGSVFTDRVTMALVDAQTLVASTRTYYLKRETRQLMVYDGESTDLPVLDHVSDFVVQYPGTPPAAHLRLAIHVESTIASAGSSNARRTIEFDVAPRSIAAVP
jgi:hypothetical protein